jgi:short-subunit dehydrogenase
MELTGRTIWITGASSGIGEALAYELAGRGARLTLSARRADELERVRAACARPHRDQAAEHDVVPLDLADPASLEAAARQVLARSGPPDVMVHNGGISQRARAEDTDMAVVRRILEVDFFGTVALTLHLLPAMLERGSGSFVVVTSLVGKIGTPLRSSYSAAKHALHGWFDSLRAEVHDRGVRVTLVCPGFVRTPLPVYALTGDGTPQGTMDRAQRRGLDPARVARRIARAIERGEDELLIAGPERLGVHLARLSPGLLRRVIRRARVT